ncbi:MAG: hypothetical protein AAFP78_02970, partial [Pseudomonadota bacterium]
MPVHKGAVAALKKHLEAGERSGDASTARRYKTDADRLEAMGLLEELAATGDLSPGERRELAGLRAWSIEGSKTPAFDAFIRKHRPNATPEEIER